MSTRQQLEETAMDHGVQRRVVKGMRLTDLIHMVENMERSQRVPTKADVPPPATPQPQPSPTVEPTGPRPSVGSLDDSLGNPEEVSVKIIHTKYEELRQELHTLMSNHAEKLLLLDSIKFDEHRALVEKSIHEDQARCQEVHLVLAELYNHLMALIAEKRKIMRIAANDVGAVEGSLLKCEMIAQLILQLADVTVE